MLVVWRKISGGFPAIRLPPLSTQVHPQRALPLLNGPALAVRHLTGQGNDKVDECPDAQGDKDSNRPDGRKDRLEIIRPDAEDYPQDGKPGDAESKHHEGAYRLFQVEAVDAQKPQEGGKESRVASRFRRNLLCFYGYLTPFVPLSFEGEGEVLRRGLAPSNFPLLTGQL